MAVLKERLGVGVSFDVLVRTLQVGGRKAAVLFVDGLVKGKEFQDILESLMRVEKGELAPQPIEKLMARAIPWMEIDVVESVEEVVREVLAGPPVLLVDGCAQGIVLDLREYPVRSVEEPDLERVTRGSRDGLVETVVFNTALIRRRLRDPRLRFEMLQAGEHAQTDVVVAYMEDQADPQLVETLKRKIEEAPIHALTMGARSLVEYILPSGLNPLPRGRFTERPDVVAAHLLEGHVVLLVDTTPQALILPANAWHFTQHVEEFFQKPIVGTYLRWIRFFGIGISLLLGPLWLALALTPDQSLPTWLRFIGPKQEPTIPLWAQFFILEAGLDLLRIALIHTPSAFATSLGIVGAILLGDLAVQVGMFVPETILYIALVAIGYFATPSVEFALALRLFRYGLLVLVTFLRLPGLLVGLVLVLIIMARTRSLDLPYLWPLIPFDWDSLVTILFRFPVPRLGTWRSRRGREDSPAGGGSPSPQPSGSAQ